MLTGHPLVFGRVNPSYKKRQKISFIWQNKVQQHWNITNQIFCVILGTKRLGLSKNTQGFSLGTLLYFEGATPSYKKQQSEKLHMTEKVLSHWNTHPFLCDFGHEGVNIRKCSSLLTEYPPVFWRGNPKLQETAKKHTSYDRTRFNSMGPRL